MRHWVFSCVPRVWDLQKFLLSGSVKDSFSIPKYIESEISPGDKGYVMLGVDRRTRAHREYNGLLLRKLDAGIYAEVEITSNPTDIIITASDMEFYNDKGFINRKPQKKYVMLRYVKNLLQTPVTRQEMKNAGITNSNLVKGQQESCREIAFSVFDQVQNLINTKSNAWFNPSGSMLDMMLDHQLEKLNSKNQILQLENKLKNQVINRRQAIIELIERSNYSSVLKKKCNYSCMICSSLGVPTNSFVKPNGDIYVEAHHVNQISNMIKGSNAPSNIAILCPVHHRQIHYGNARMTERNRLDFTVSIDGTTLIVKKIR